jgi:hypothetical protein
MLKLSDPDGFCHHHRTAGALQGLGVTISARRPPGRTERLLADSQIHPISGVRVEVILSAILALIVAVLGALLALAG